MTCNVILHTYCFPEIVQEVLYCGSVWSMFAWKTLLNYFVTKYILNPLLRGVLSCLMQ